MSKILILIISDFKNFDVSPLQKVTNLTLPIVSRGKCSNSIVIHKSSTFFKQGFSKGLFRFWILLVYCKRPKNLSNHLNFHNPCSSVRFLLAAVWLTCLGRCFFWSRCFTLLLHTFTTPKRAKYWPNPTASSLARPPVYFCWDICFSRRAIPRKCWPDPTMLV